MSNHPDPASTQRVTYDRTTTTLEVGDGYELEPCVNCRTTGRVALQLGAALTTCPVCHGARMVPVKVQLIQRGLQ